MFPWLIPSSFSPPASLISQSQDKYYLRDFKVLLVLLSFTITTGPWNQDPELGGLRWGERGSCAGERAHGRPGPPTPHPSWGRFPRHAASPPHTKQPCWRLWLLPHGDSALWKMGKDCLGPSTTQAPNNSCWRRSVISPKTSYTTDPLPLAQRQVVPASSPFFHTQTLSLCHSLPSSALCFRLLLHSRSLAPNPSPISSMPSGATISDNECFNIFFSIVLSTEAYLLPKVCIFWLPSLVEAAISPTHPETGGRGWRQDSPGSLVLHKPHQSLCHLRLPFSISYKHWRRVLYTSSHHAKSWPNSETFKPICGWPSNTLVFSSLIFSSLKAELVMVWKSLATKDTRPSSSLTTPVLQERAKPNQ